MQGIKCNKQVSEAQTTQRQKRFQANALAANTDWDTLWPSSPEYSSLLPESPRSASDASLSLPEYAIASPRLHHRPRKTPPAPQPVALCRSPGERWSFTAPPASNFGTWRKVTAPGVGGGGSRVHHWEVQADFGAKSWSEAAQRWHKSCKAGQESWHRSLTPRWN